MRASRAMQHTMWSAAAGLWVVAALVSGCEERRAPPEVQGSARPPVATVVPDSGPGEPEAGVRSPAAAEDAGTGATGDGGLSALPGDTGPVVEQRGVHGMTVTALASSVLPGEGQEGLRYGPARVLDDDPATVWATSIENSKEPPWVELRFPEAIRMRALHLVPGHGKSEALYRANARPRKVQVLLRLNDDHPVAVSTYEFEFARDLPFGSSVFIPRHTPLERAYIRGIRLTILSAWAGEKYQDLCISRLMPLVDGPDGTVIGQGTELVPTIVELMRHYLPYKYLPGVTDVPVWAREHEFIPADGPLPDVTHEEDLRHGYTGVTSWSGLTEALRQRLGEARLHGGVFRLQPVPGSSAQWLDPMPIPAKQPAHMQRFRMRWNLFSGQWRFDEFHLVRLTESERSNN